MGAKGTISGVNALVTLVIAGYITVFAGYALSLGHNGTVIMLTIGCLCSAGGFVSAKVYKPKTPLPP